MDLTYPFNKAVAGEIRSLATVVFAGGDPTNDSELYELWLKWHWWFDLFFWCVERKTASYLHYPMPGTITQQGYCTMNILNLLQSLYISEIYKNMGK